MFGSARQPVPELVLGPLRGCLGAVVCDRERRVRHDQATECVGVVRREHDRDLATERVPVQNGPVAHDLREEARDIRHIVAQQVVPRHVPRLAVAAQIWRVDVPCAGHGFDKLLTMLPARGPAVEDDEGPPIAADLRRS